MKNINWKKYAGAAMAAAMIPAAVAPIATEAAGSIGGHTGYNIKITLDGQPANYLFDQKQFELRSTDGQVVVTIEKQGYFWLKPNKTYKIYDVTNGADIYKGTIKVNNNSGNFVTMEYKTVQETKTVKAADFDLTADSTAYYEDETGGHFGIKGIYKSPNAKLIVNQEQASFENSIEAHAPAKIKYDLTGKDVTSFTGLVGIDERRNSGAVNVEVLVDGQQHSSFVKKKGDEATPLNIDLTNVSTLEFVLTGATDATNANENALLVLADGQFEQQVKTIK